MNIIDKIRLKIESKKIISRLKKGQIANNKSIEDLKLIAQICKENIVLKFILKDIISEIENTIYIGEQLDKRINQLVFSLVNIELKFIQTQALIVKTEQLRFNDKLQAVNQKLQRINLYFKICTDNSLKQR